MILKPKASLRKQRRSIGDNNCDIAIHIGDSRTNGANFEPGGMDSKYLGDKRKILIYYKPDRSNTNDGAWETFNAHLNHAPGYARPSDPYPCGPMYAFAWKCSTVVKKSIGIVKVGVGGTGILQVASTDNDWWIPTNYSPDENDIFSEFYYNFLDLSLRYIQLLKFKKNVKIRCAFVSLGVNDCLTTRWNSTNFSGGVTRLVTFMRNTLGLPNLPIYWEGPRADLYLAPSGLYTQADVDACRAILTGFASTIPNFNVENHDSAAMDADGVHNTADGDFQKGEARADTFLTLI